MGMAPITFRLAVFENESLDTRRSTKVLVWLLEALVQINMLWLAEKLRAGIPLEKLSIYSSDAIYKLDGEGVNDWLDIPSVIRRGYADCKSLASWRIAELRLAGIKAAPFVRWPSNPANPKKRVMHALVRWPGGKIEDPSIALGMRGVISRRPVWVAPEGSEAE